MQTLLGHHWHHLPVDEVVQLLDSDVQKGLDQFEINHRLQHFGRNAITPKKGKSSLVRFLLQFNNPLIYILLASSLITAIIKDPLDALIILAVVLINAVIGFVQESKAEEAIKSLAQTLSSEANTIRTGQSQRLPSYELVPGDIVLLQSGDRVPADLRLLRSRDLQIAEAALTGESVAVQKKAEASLDPDTGLADRRNMAYASTLVTYGQATGIVTATGDQTEIGRISRLISEAEELQTPLTRKIAQFSRLLLYVILALAAVTFTVGLIRGQAAIDTFNAAVAMAVAMIPEGLPAALSLTLALGVTRMARRKAIIRKLPAVETLGSVTVICSDKTGTLTQNQMTVSEILAGGMRYQVSGGGYAPKGQILRQGQPATAGQSMPALNECLKAGLLCNDSRLVEKEGQWLAEGDPTEVAMITSAVKAGIETGELIRRFPRVDAIPFDSQFQYMASLHTNEADPTRPALVYVKGSVEAILTRAATALDDAGRETPLEPEKIHTIVNQMANHGLRVLAFAHKELPPGTQSLQVSDIDCGLVFLGLQAMIDPPRAEAIAAIRDCQDAGIRVKMITGDHALTAAAIATQVGLAQMCADDSPPQDCVLTGKQIAALSDQELIEAAEETAVFARVSPEQKLRLVEAMQARGHVVAMTGDGVNDGPALKQSNIGIAMGITGTEVAKEAADILLTDDNFATIRAAVEEGRGVFDNLTKIIAWTLPTNLGQGLIILVAILAGIALPIIPIHILWINTISASVLGLVLAMERKEPGIMRRAPRKPDQPILSNQLLVRIVLVAGMILIGAFGLFEVGLGLGLDISQARTIAVNIVVMIEIFYLFNCRSLGNSIFQIGVFSNRWVFIGIGVMLLLQMLFTYAPFMNDWMSTAPIPAESWIAIVGVGLVSYLLVEVEKWLRRRTR